jgi:hypothetical protein
MRTRLDFHNKLVEALGTPYVYFQPPEDIRMHRGNRIIYSREEIPFTLADNTKYSGHTRYSVTLVSKDPDWALVQELPFLFQFCRHDRHYVADNLNHDVYIIYY